MLLTANAVGNFVKYMLFTVAYNIKKKCCLILTDGKKSTNKAQAKSYKV